MSVLAAISNLFINTAYAADAAPGAQPAGGGGFSMLIIMLMVVVFMYLMVWRPQNKRNQEQKNMLKAISVGDEVVTIGGLIGKVSKINENYIMLSPADNIQIPFQKSAIANVLPKGTLKTIS